MNEGEYIIYDPLAELRSLAEYVKKQQAESEVAAHGTDPIHISPGHGAEGDGRSAGAGG